ncbi:MAG: alpha/beta hydrolase [Bryobacteraceae bacterium]|jgi:pimeloyl-ACP methyl ester carboxylesterase
MNSLNFGGSIILVCGTLMAFAGGPANAAPVKNIVLVHGAFADGSGWKAVYEILANDGYNVTAAQPPLTGLEDDVAAVVRVLCRQDGPTILVGHSYGGAIITEAGIDPQVVALVFIAAHAPDVGETQADSGKRFPSAGRDAIRLTDDAYALLDPGRFPAEFAGDLPKQQADFETHSQVFTASAAFSTPIRDAAWKTKPSWYLVARSDRIINPDLEWMYAKRANSTTVEIDGASHSVYASHPVEVAKLIEDAAQHVGSSGRAPE